MTVYLVALTTPKGTGTLEVPTMQGPDAAGRRALFSACALGWGDVDTITIASVVAL